MSNKLAVTMLVLLIVSITSFSNPRELENRVTEYSVRLELTEEQVDEIKPILEETSMEKKNLLEQIKIADKKRDQRRLAKELKKVDEKTNNKLTKVLTTEQAVEWKKIRKEVKDRVA